MNNKFQNIQTVQFQEHPVMDFTQSEPADFDITAKCTEILPNFVSNGFFIMEAYCMILVCKIQNLKKDEIADFIDYQCALVKNPLTWLDHLETLIELNYKYFETDCQQSWIQKLYVIMQFKRQELKPRRKPLKDNLIDANEITSNEMVKFDFRTVKFDLNKMDSFEEKKAYLIELRAEFLESEQYFRMNNGKSLDGLIDIEMEKLERLESIKWPAQIKGKSSKNGHKIRILGNLNVFVDVFYQMLYEVKVDEQPFLDSTPTEIAEMIVERFVDKDGRELSLSTIRTILSPGKCDKRPNNDKRLKLKI
jgi:hypothetical protein